MACLNLVNTATFGRFFTLRLFNRPFAHRHIKSLQYGLLGSCRTLCVSSTGVEKLTQSYSHGLASHPLIGDTVGQRLDKVAERFPNREAYVCYEDKERATFAELREEADQLAASLLSLGIKRGDRVGIWGPNMREWVISQFGTARIGVILVNVNPAYQAPEAEYALKKVGCKGLIMADTHKTQDYYNMMTHIAHELSDSSPGELYSNRVPDLRVLVVTTKDKNKKYGGAFTFDEFMKIGGEHERQQIRNMQMALQSDDPINIQFTSGTTGNPKGVTLTHHGILNNAASVGDILNYAEYTRVCIPVPLYHCFGMVLGSFACVTHGITAVYPSRGFDAGLALDAVQNEKCNSLYGTPTMFIDMLNHPKFEQYDVTSLRTGIMAGAPCPVEVMKKIITTFHMPEMTIAYGLTETSPVTNQTRRDVPVDLRVSTVGTMAPNVEAKIIDSEHGNVVPINTPGEICFRGYNVMQGYWDDYEKTDAAIDSNGWFHSGDLATMDENGFVKIIGRIKDVIIRGGENIYPTEVEQFLYKHPKIQDVQIIGIPDERLGEEVCACIRLHPGESSSPEEIKEFCKGQIAHFKIPKYIKFTEEYPLTISGKVRKFVMREQMIHELGL
ncbi:medium-chain acyl-CoA ligase ACSF2, mitochondrial-like [Nematostella vectensis]|uniref:medium-chain acyl-CoA ligase ACSF2, mitochondrial-like n=1 Tax=Nematostella vectensis TaxID=45351 RepID=UPI0020770D7E|nr:medium-chain acyl-CoA ligase ACSF2, mitochondrial-like [Nematostella vectensis]